MNINFKFFKLLSICVLICGMLGGCSTKYKNLASEEVPALSNTDLQNARILVNHAKPGMAVSLGKLYDQSGVYFSNCMKDIAQNFNSKVKLSNTVLSENDLLKSVRNNNNMDYLIFGTIVNWEDHATEWTGEPDRINIDIKLIEVKSGAVMAHENFISSSKWLTFGGDHPQDLLAGPLIDIFRKWFRSNITLNPENFPCEISYLKSDY